MVQLNIFDFDGTLTTDTWPKFWVWVNKFGLNGEKRNNELESKIKLYGQTHAGNSLEKFFGFFNDLLVSKNEKLTISELLQGERFVKYNPGVEDFLRETKSNVQIKNYIISGGLREYLQGLKIAQYFNGIYGSPVVFDENGLISGINMQKLVTDERKVLLIQDILKKNNIENEDCTSVVYIGDGYSDKPAMEYVHLHGGNTVFVHQPTQGNEDEHTRHINEIYNKLNSRKIIDYKCVADFGKGSKLRNILEGIQKQKEDLSIE